MKCTGILMSAPMVRASLDGSKTQTRRVVKPQPSVWLHYIQPMHGVSPDGTEFGDKTLWREVGPDYPDGDDDDRRCPYGRVGDTLWVRETCWMFGEWKPNGFTSTNKQKWRFNAFRECPPIFHAPMKHELTYKGSEYPGYARRNSIHMPRSASRIMLVITGVRVERLRDINDGDCQAEGVTCKPHTHKDRDCEEIGCIGPWREAYACLWDSLNGARAPWKRNPWVWVVTFKRIQSGAMAA